MDNVFFVLTALILFFLFLVVSGLINVKIGFRVKFKRGGRWYKVGYQKQPKEGENNGQET